MTDPFQPDTAELGDDARQLLRELDRDTPGVSLASAECRPPLDVIETAAAVEVVMDIPGVAADSLRVAIRRSTLLIVGAKATPPVDPDSRYHLAERSYGRFARAVRLTGAFDSGAARAVTGGGLLRVTLPRLQDRRGQSLRIPVERG